MMSGLCLSDDRRKCLLALAGAGKAGGGGEERGGGDGELVTLKGPPDAQEVGHKGSRRSAGWRHRSMCHPHTVSEFMSERCLLQELSLPGTVPFLRECVRILWVQL